MNQPLPSNHEIKVEAIRSGTVIDHIQAGRAAVLLQAMRLMDRDLVVSVGFNFRSQRREKKDLIKIENYELSEDDVARLAILAPECTINIIRDFTVTKKFQPIPPTEIARLAKCPNPQCITNHEPLVSHFHVIKNGSLALRCHYCEKSFSLEDLRFS